MSAEKTIYVGMHDGVCAVTSDDGGASWQQGPVTPLPHAAARLAASPANPGRAYLAAYEAGVYRTDDEGKTWMHLDSYPSDYAHSVLAHPTEGDTLYVGSEPATVYRSDDGGDTWAELEGFTQVPESVDWSFHSPTRDSHVRDLRVAPDDPGPALRRHRSGRDGPLRRRRPKLAATAGPQRRHSLRGSERRPAKQRLRRHRPGPLPLRRWGQQLGVD